MQSLKNKRVVFVSGIKIVFHNMVRTFGKIVFHSLDCISHVESIVCPYSFTRAAVDGIMENPREITFSFKKKKKKRIKTKSN